MFKFSCLKTLLKKSEPKIYPKNSIIKKSISLKIALDTQHKWKRGKSRDDRGASYRGLQEAEIVQQYFEKAKEALVKAGHQIFMNNVEDEILVGSYNQRHLWANSNSIDLYLAGHINSAEKPGNYSLVMVKHDVSPEIFNLANSLAEKFKSFLSTKFATVWKVMPEDDPLTLRDENRGWVCVSGVECPAFLLEPCFLNLPESYDSLKSGMGQSLIASAIVEWVQEYVDHLKGK